MNDGFIDSILPITLGADHDRFEALFYPNVVPFEGRKPNPADRRREGAPIQFEFVDLLAELNEIMTQLKVGFALLKDVAVNNALYSDLRGDPEAFAAYHRRRAAYFAEALVEKRVVPKVATFLQMLRGNSHVIRPSLRYEGGYDVLWVGKPSSYRGSPLLGADYVHGLSATLSPLSAVSDFDLDRGVAVHAVSALSQIVSTLLNALPSADRAHKRQVAMLPLSFDFTQFNNYLFPRDDGFPLAVPLFPHTLVRKNVSAGLQSSLAQLFSILVVYTPDPLLVADAARQVRAGQPVANRRVACPEALALEPNLSLSIALHLPRRFVEFVTQTPPNEKPALASLNTWLNAWKQFAFQTPLKKKDVYQHKRVPRYVLRTSALNELVAKRKAIGMAVEEGCTDANGIFIANNGSLNYMLGTSQATDLPALDYERTVTSVIDLCGDLLMPVDFSSAAVPDTYVAEAGRASVVDDLAALHRSLALFAGKLLGFSWDFHLAVHVNAADPSKVAAASLSGATRPDALAIADYLKKPFAESLRLMLPSVRAQEGADRATAGQWGANSAPDAMLALPLFTHLFNLYEVLAQQGLAPGFQALVRTAAADLKVKGLADGEEMATYEDGIYHTVLSADLVDLNGTSVPESAKVQSVLSSALREAAAAPGTKHYKRLQALPDSEARADAKVLSGRYFSAAEAADAIGRSVENPLVCSLARFANVYRYVGGRVFYLMLTHVQRHLSKLAYKFDYTDDQVPVAMVDGRKALPTYAMISRQIGPLVTALAVYVPESASILAKAEALARVNARNPDVDESWLKVPGSIPTAEVFPHQIKVHQYLRNRPRFALLAVSAGGGKTVATLIDIMCCVRECREQRVAIKPLVLAPSNLVRNWVEDLTKIVGKNWNIIPITTQIIRRWGLKALADMIRQAPVNTIVVCGMSALTKTGKYRIAFANHTHECSEALDMIRSLDFNYVAVDEAHKLKNVQTHTHKMLKQLCTASNVLYVRLASGTMVSNEVRDIVGVTSVLSSQIFRTVEEYTNEKTLLLGDKEINVRDRNYNQLTSDKLAKHVALISVKRKEWAFMLPIPVESFQYPSMDYSASIDRTTGAYSPQLRKRLESGTLTEEEIYLASMHRAAYEALVEEMAHALRQELAKRSVDDEDLESDDLDEIMASPLGKYWLQRADQFLLDPLGDEMAKLAADDARFDGLPQAARDGWLKIIDAFSRMRETKFAPRKLRIVFERIREHYQDKPWTAGETYTALKSDVDYNGVRYVARKRNLASAEEEMFVSNVPPDQAPDQWKPEARGKVIIFCRYNRSVEAIANAMPADLAKRTVLFYGWMTQDDRLSNLERFLTDPATEVLLANEEGLNEGWNLTVASRLIRVELPWTPSALEQGQSRIFRPDPKGYAAGNGRSVVHIDIVSSNRTLEMNKLGRLYSKVIGVCKYEEADNPLYDSLQAVDDEALRLRLGKLDVRRFLSFEELSPYQERDAQGRFVHPKGLRLQSHLGAWTEYVTIRNAEFLMMKHEARKTGTDRMVPLPPTPMLPGTVRLPRVPFVPNQEIDLLAHDDDKLGLVKFADYISNPRNAADLKAAQEGARALAARMKGFPALTDLGYGTVTGFTTRKSMAVDDSEDLDDTALQYKLKVSQVRMRLVDGTDVSVPSSIVYLATTVRPELMRKFVAKGAVFVPVPDDVEAAPRPVPDDTAALMANLARRRALVSRRAHTFAKVSVIPIQYNGKLALEAFSGGKPLFHEYGFTVVPEYAYFKVLNLDNFYAVTQYLFKASGFTPDTAAVPLLKAAHRAFDQGTRKFDASQFSGPAFHTWAHVSVASGQLRLLPYVLHKPRLADQLRQTGQSAASADQLYLAVDLATNPRFAAFVGRAVPGTAPPLTVNRCPQMEIRFVDDPGSALKVMRTLVASNKFDLDADDLEAFEAILSTILGDTNVQP